MTKKIRKEVYSRQKFAYEKGLFYYDKIKHVKDTGNVFSCKSTLKFLQARRIYIHYTNEFQINQELPLSK